MPRPTPLFRLGCFVALFRLGCFVALLWRVVALELGFVLPPVRAALVRLIGGKSLFHQRS
jgi:hypothetical protein